MYIHFFLYFFLFLFICFSFTIQVAAIAKRKHPYSFGMDSKVVVRFRFSCNSSSVFLQKWKSQARLPFPLCFILPGFFEGYAIITLIPTLFNRFVYSVSIPSSVIKYLILSVFPKEANNTLSSLLESASR